MRRANVGLLLLFTHAAFAGILFNQGPPDNVNGRSITAFRTADAFNLAASGTVAAVQFWWSPICGGSTADFNGTITYAFYQDAAGSLGALIATGTVSGIVSTPTGLSLAVCVPGQSAPIQSAAFTLNTPVSLAPGTYWLELHEGNSLTTGDGTNTVWTTFAQAGSAKQDTDPTLPATNKNQAMAFQLLDQFGNGGNPYQVRYAANLTSGIDSVINIINTGGNGNVPVNGPGFGANNGGNMCVNVYTLDPNEELLNCCSCLITPNQVVNLKVQANLMSNTLTGFPTPSATIKIIGSTDGTTPAAVAATSCANESAQVNLSGGTHSVTGGFVAFGTTPHTTTAGQFAVTETPFLSVTLSPSELTSLTTRCAAILGNASGAGVCPGCAKGALGANKQ